MFSGLYHHSRDVFKLRKYLPKRERTELDAALLVWLFCFIIWLLLTFLFHNMTSVPFVLYDATREYVILKPFNNIFHSFEPIFILFFFFFFFFFQKKQHQKGPNSKNLRSLPLCEPVNKCQSVSDRLWQIAQFRRRTVHFDRPSYAVDRRCCVIGWIADILCQIMDRNFTPCHWQFLQIGIILKELFNGFSQFFSRRRGTLWNFTFAIRLPGHFIFIACSSLLKLRTLFSQNWIFWLRPFSMQVIHMYRVFQNKPHSKFYR